MLAERYHWTPEQIVRMDPDFVFEVLTRIRAEGDHQAAEERRNKRKGKRSGGGRNVVDAELSEIE